MSNMINKITNLDPKCVKHKAQKHVINKESPLEASHRFVQDRFHYLQCTIPKTSAPQESETVRHDQGVPLFIVIYQIFPHFVHTE